MNMDIAIWDVEHGGCASILTPTGKLILVDCGHNASTGWRPSSWLHAYDLVPDLLLVTNLDEDHVTDLPNVHRVAKPRMFNTNRKIDPDWALQKKQEIGGPRPGVQHAIDYLRTYTGTPAPMPDWGMDKRYFSLSPNQFDDFNNLSLVTFIFVGEFGIIFPGDLQREGWSALLESEDFQECLTRTNIFMASHHGREDGYHEGVFEFCRPDLVVISDKAIMHQTQQGMANIYWKHARGLTHQITGEERRVLTTRRDGIISVNVDENGYYRVNL